MPIIHKTDDFLFNLFPKAKESGKSFEVAGRALILQRQRRNIISKASPEKSSAAGTITVWKTSDVFNFIKAEGQK
ncbi:MAG: hypothetical protein C4560_04505 [Nitrospiraceae bacterium]|nr:MAG: hypothetical protein C4560_04505 [Nitrospiraceae bacterium]